MDDVTALRDALLDDISDPTRFDALPPDRVGHLRDRFDALIAAVEARAALGVVETPETAFEALRPRTRAGWALLGREALNSRSFALITAADIVAVEQEAAALAALPRPDEPRVERCAFKADGMRCNDTPIQHRAVCGLLHSHTFVCHPFTPEARR